MINICKKGLVESFKADLANFKQIYKAVKSAKMGRFCKKNLSKRPKTQNLRATPILLLNHTFPNFPHDKITLFKGFSRVCRKRVYFFTVINRFIFLNQP